MSIRARGSFAEQAFPEGGFVGWLCWGCLGSGIVFGFFLGGWAGVFGFGDFGECLDGWNCAGGAAGFVFEPFFEDGSDEGSGVGAAVHGVVVWFPFECDGEGDVGAFCGGEASEPAHGAFDAFCEPLGGAGFSSDGDTWHGCAGSGPASAGHDGDHGFAEDEEGGGGKFDLVGDSWGEGVDDFARNVLDLGDEA